MEYFIDFYFKDFIETEPDFLRQLADALANPEFKEFLSKFIQLIGHLYAFIFLFIAILFGIFIFLICDVLYDLIPVLYRKIKEKRKQKKASDIEVITYDEFNERRQKKGEPDERID